MARNVRAGLAALLALGAWSLGAASPTEAAIVTGCPATQADLSALITSAGVGGTVNFNCSVATTIPFTSTMFIDKSVTLNGLDSRPVTFDGQNATQLFQVGTLGGPVTFTINGLTLARGHSSGRGGVMRNFGTVQILNSLLVGNTAVNAGGAIDNWETVLIRNSTLTQNQNAIFNGANTVGNVGVMTIESSTIAHNTGSYAINNTSGGTVTVTASIIADNTSSYFSYNCNGTLTSGGYNVTHRDTSIHHQNTCGLTTATDLAHTNPHLHALADNGGPTQTMAMRPHSAGANRIPSSTGLCPSTDQRGVLRFDSEDPACDVGAYEHLNNLMVTVAEDFGQYVVNITGHGLVIGSTLSWHAHTSYLGTLSGSAVVDADPFHLQAFTGICEFYDHVSVEVQGREGTAHTHAFTVDGHFSGPPCPNTLLESEPTTLETSTLETEPTKKSDKSRGRSSRP